jgi:hypothetical protein
MVMGIGVVVGVGVEVVYDDTVRDRVSKYNSS